MFRDLIRKGAMWSSQTDITNWFRGESDQVGKGRQDWNCGKGKAGKGWLQRVNRVRICGTGMVENGWRGRVGWKIYKHVLYLDVDGSVSTCKWSSIHPTCKWSSIHPTWIVVSRRAAQVNFDLYLTTLSLDSAVALTLLCHYLALLLTPTSL